MQANVSRTTDTEKERQILHAGSKLFVQDRILASVEFPLNNNGEIVVMNDSTKSTNCLRQYRKQCTAIQKAKKHKATHRYSLWQEH